MRRRRPSSRGPTGRRRARGRGRFGLALAMALWLAAGALAAQEEARVPTPEELATMTDEDLVEAGLSVGFHTEDLPYAMLVDSLFTSLTEDDDLDAWWSNRGLDPESDSFRQLESLAHEIEAAHPARPDWRAVDPSFETDDEARNAWIRAAQDRRYRALGVGFGSWLEDRRIEGYPPEFYLDRVLNEVSRTIFSTESMEELEEWMDRAAREFEIGLRQEMSTLPRQLTSAWRTGD